MDEAGAASVAEAGAAPAGNPGPCPAAQAGRKGQASGKGQARIQVSSPGGVLAVVPHLLGFHPSRSLVVIGAGGPRARIKLGFRYDLPDPPGPAAAAALADHATTLLGQRGVTTVIGVGYGPGTLVTPVTDALAAAVRQAGLELRELLRVEDGRYWSYLCQDISCCPAAGVPFDPASHPAAPVLAAAGASVHANRETLAATLAPVDGEAERAMERAIGHACEKAGKLMAKAVRQGVRPATRPVSEAGRRAVQAAITRYRDGGQITEPRQLAWLLVTLAHLPVRDDAWARMEPEYREQHRRCWTDLVRHAHQAWLPAPASLLAFTAWQCGEGALANIAVERALGADPGYSMALLMRDILTAGLPPSAARLPMTPDEVARSYEEASQRNSASQPDPEARPEMWQPLRKRTDGSR